MVRRKKYSKEFKINAVRMVSEEGRVAAEVARDLDISSNMLYSWKQKYLEEKEDSFQGNGNQSSKDEQIRKLEKENKRLKEERDILKKATQFFAREP
jgi:transposase